MAQEKAVGTYDPKGPAAIIAFLLFGAIAVLLWISYFKTRPRARYMRTICVGCTFMSIGFIIRFSRRNGINAWAFVFETLCLLLSPCAFLAEIYMLLPRLSKLLDADDWLRFPPKGIVITFLLADIVTVMGQIAGVALQATFRYPIGIGVKTTMASLFVQLAFFVIFTSVYVVFGRRICHHPKHEYERAASGVKDMLTSKNDHWKSLYYAIGFASGCMIMRGVAAGGSSSFADNEVLSYILDAVPMFLFVSAFTLVWPPRCLERQA